MKKITLIAIIAAFMFSVNTYSENGDNVDFQTQKVYYGKISEKYDLKVVLQYDTLGNRVERTLYAKGKRQNWFPVHKHEFRYNNQSKVEDVIFTKWDKKNKEWEKTSSYLIHSYDDTGKILSVRQMTINNGEYFTSN